MPFVVGETVGAYRIVEQLGQGGMATVYKAYHPALDRYVALKAMHPAFMEDPNFLARFQREAQVVARLDHPNIVPIYDYAEHEGRPYLVIKYIEGETLKARLGQADLAKADVITVVKAVSSALSYAHKEGILHRDIKPSNVLLSVSGNIYLADFGLARIAEAGQSTLSTDVMLGTPQYISPEQAMGKRDLDASSDIYSFGVMLYEMVLGQVPFSADTPYSIIHDHIYTPLPLPRSIDPSISEEIQRVLLQALAKEPGDRYDDINQMADEFIKALQDLEPVADHPAAVVDLSPPGEIREPAVAVPDLVAPLKELDLGSLAPAADTLEPAIEAGQDREIHALKKSRRWRWWYSIPIILSLCICGFLTLSVLSAEGEAGTGPEPNIEEGAPNSPASDEGEPLPVADRPGPGPDHPVQAAQEAVRNNPEDPFAHLELALAYTEAGNYDAAQEALAESQALAGDGNPDVLLAAGDMLAEREMWLLGAGAYLRLADLEPDGLPPDVVERIELALYLAAGDPGARGMFGNRDRYPGMDPLFTDVARARFQINQGKAGQGEAVLGSVLEREPGYPPAELLLAEIMLETGEHEEAVRMLHDLAGRREPPFWVQMAAEDKLVEIGG